MHNIDIRMILLGMDMCRKFLEMGFTRADDIRFRDGKKYDENGNVKQRCKKIWATSSKSITKSLKL